MARIAGVDLPKNKRLEIALTYLYGIGPTRAKEIMQALGLEASLRVHQLSDAQVAQIRNYIESHYKVEGELRREVAMNIKRLMDINCYRGIRHKKGLPVRGQRTRSNARTRKGPRKTVANKKKAVK